MSAANDSAAKDNLPSKPLSLLGTAHGRFVHGRRTRQLAEHFARLIPAGHRVLDVGCGDGEIDHLIMELRPNVQIQGVEVAPRSASSISVSAFDGQNLPFGDDSFDCVMFCDVLHHTHSVSALLREAARVARHYVLIKDHFLQGAFAGATLRFMDYVGNAPHGVALPYHYLTPDQWNTEWQAAQLTTQSITRDLKLYPWWGNWLFGRGLHFVALLKVSDV